MLAIDTSKYSRYYELLDAFEIPMAGRMNYTVHFQSPTSEEVTEESSDFNFVENIAVEGIDSRAFLWTSSPYYRTNPVK